jgi:cation diffusion facilitator CzcD-associated flavoprotein CzcO
MCSVERIRGVCNKPGRMVFLYVSTHLPLAGPWQQFSFSEFPWPAHIAPSSPAARATAAHVLAYCKAYAVHFKLDKVLRRNCRVVRVALDSSTSSKVGGTGARVADSQCRWTVVFEDLASGEHVQLWANHVVVATGAHTHPHTPTYQVGSQ